MGKTKIERLKEEAEEYAKYVKRVSELASEQASKNASDASKSMKSSASDFANHSEKTNRKVVSNQAQTEAMIASLKAKGFSDYKSLREKEFNELEVSLATGEISNEEYYSRLAVLRDVYFQEGSNGWAKYTLEIAKYNQSVLEEQQKQLEAYNKRIMKEQDKQIKDSVKMLRSGFNEANSLYDESFNNIIKKQNSLKNKLDGISDMYNIISGDSDDKTDGYKWIQLSDINTEIEVLKNYNNNLIEARDRVNKILDEFGFDDKKTSRLKSEFLEELAGMNINDATQFTKYLSNISSEKITDYLSKWAEKSDLEAFIPNNIFGEESFELIERYASDMSQNFSKTLEEKFGDIPDSFFENGSESANRFKEGFIDAIDEVMSDISSEINQRIIKLLPETIVTATGSQVSNYSNYNIYGALEPQQTALEIYKEEAKRRMLIGDN